jgi:hypothetical protein
VVLDLNRVLAFVAQPTAPKNEVRVNFGVFAGRPATAAEIEELAQALVPEFGQVTIVAEERHELSGHSAMSVHQVRIELPDEADPERVVVVAEHWAQACIADRHTEIAEP